MTEIYKTICNSHTQTFELGAKLAMRLNNGAVTLLEGGMGAGKSVFARGMIKALGYEGAVTSPTFALMNQYPTVPEVYHFDLYRLDYPEQLYDIGYEEYLYSDGISIIEWPSKMDFLYPKHFILVRIEIIGENKRKISIAASCDYMLKNGFV